MFEPRNFVIISFFFTRKTAKMRWPKKYLSLTVEECRWTLRDPWGCASCAKYLFRSYRVIFKRVCTSVAPRHALITKSYQAHLGQQIFHLGTRNWRKMRFRTVSDWIQGSLACTAAYHIICKTKLVSWGRHWSLSWPLRSYFQRDLKNVVDDVSIMRHSLRHSSVLIKPVASRSALEITI